MILCWISITNQRVNNLQTMLVFIVLAADVVAIVVIVVVDVVDCVHITKMFMEIFLLTNLSSSE